MNTTPTPCYCCNDPIERKVGDPQLVARFEGGLMDVCEDCATGIYGGIETLKINGVVGEHLGPCGDNESP